MSGYQFAHMELYMRQLAGWVWDQQIEAFSFGMSKQEETLTENLLVEMAKTLQPQGLRVRMFSRQKEGGRRPKGKDRIPGTGADWEWFYEGPPCMARFRVQAKRLYPSPHHPGEYGGFEPGGQQVHDLIDDAQGMNPVYVFYNHPQVSDHDLFEPSGPPEHFGQSCWGCGATTAAFMRSVPDAKLSTIIKGQVPWHRFFGISGTCLPRDAIEKANAAIYDEGEPQEFIPAESRPEWVIALLEGNQDQLMSYCLENRLEGVAYFRREET